MKNKKPLGIAIPYYQNSDMCEPLFKALMKELNNQIEKTDKVLIYVVEDGQNSKWLDEYKSDKITIKRLENNQGVSHARNLGIEYLKDKVNYITFIDSDDMVANDYLKVLGSYANDGTHELIETDLYVNNVHSGYPKKDKVRNSVWSNVIRVEIIGDKRFDENLQYTEDTDFIYRVIDLNKHRKIHAPTSYYYYFGRNPNSLIKRINDGRITKNRVEEKNGKRASNTDI